MERGQRVGRGWLELQVTEGYQDGEERRYEVKGVVLAIASWSMA